jgi:CRISPR-associated protein Cmr3
MSAAIWSFEALDTLFFRDGRPFNAGESTWADSQFPPMGYTLQGAIRTAMLVHLGVDFDLFRQGRAFHNGKNLKEDLGDPEGLGKLDLTGPFLEINENLLFPAPLDLVRQEQGFSLLVPGNEVHCDLGRIRLPAVTGRGAKVQEGKYVTGEAMGDLLAGNPASVKEASKGESGVSGNLWPLFPEGEDELALADREHKIGLARNNEVRRAKDGMLYAIAPVRPRRGVRLAMGVDGMDPALAPRTGCLSCQRLGGEGKLAALKIRTQSPWPGMPELNVENGNIRFKLVFATPALFPGPDWRPPGFGDVKDGNGSTVRWRGSPNGASFEIVSACLGKAARIGGWDMANNRPRDLRGFVPAGSVYFCEAETQAKASIEALHGRKIGHEQQYGFGHVLVGTW